MESRLRQQNYLFNKLKSSDNDHVNEIVGCFEVTVDIMQGLYILEVASLRASQWAQITLKNQWWTLKSQGLQLFIAL